MNLLLTLVGAFWLGSVGASEVSFEGADVYRSSTLTAKKVEDAALPLIRSYVKLRGIGSKGALKRADNLKEQIEGLVRERADLAYLRMYYGLYFTSSKRSAYVTFDVVDAKDVKGRMPFRKKPSQFLRDPEGLVASWARYQALWEQVGAKGTGMTERSRCPSLHCRWGTPTPEIEQLDRHFSQFVKSNWKALVDFSKDHVNPSKREAAIFLSAYSNDSEKVVTLLGEALEDPAENVRAAALQILSDISQYHPDVPFPIEKLVAALDYPASSDRSEAMGVLVGKVNDPDARPYILKHASPHLLNILKLKQPSNHDLAYTLLGMLSRESYDRRDYKSWQRWVDAQRTSRIKKNR